MTQASIAPLPDALVGEAVATATEGAKAERPAGVDEPLAKRPRCNTGCGFCHLPPSEWPERKLPLSFRQICQSRGHYSFDH